ncbi:GTPase IMAP family member 4-like isoform X2 [Haliotis cracherodii]|uniref:GTPase IMAP family member 4-like isoform X2 n=1 Tax=Haliotis cracherodii TaxID=6455 RepID=UPI0039E91823
MNNQVKMVLLGRHGCGKTAVIESFRGTSITQPTSSFLADNVHTVTKHDSNISIIETTGLFAEGQDIKANKMRLAESVYTFTPGPDAFGLVVRIGRFTPEVRTMIDTLRETFGEDIFRFTVFIFTRLDDLKYDGITLEKYLQESTPELKSVLNACGGRYIGFDNTGTWESRAEYADNLLSMLKNLQKQNNSMVYTVAMLEYATRCQQKIEEEDRNQQDERNRNIKEELKSTMRQELEEQIRREMQAEQRKAVSLLTSNTQQTYITTGCKPRKLQTQIYTRQTVESRDTFNERILKKGANKSKHERGPRPELKPKPTTPKVQENIISRDTHEQDAAQNERHATEDDTSANDAKPKRRGLIARMIHFWESFLPK